MSLQKGSRSGSLPLCWARRLLMAPSSCSLPPHVPQGDPSFGDHHRAPLLSPDTFTVISSGLGMDVPGLGRIIRLWPTVFPITSPLWAGERGPGCHPTPWRICKMDLGCPAPKTQRLGHNQEVGNHYKHPSSCPAFQQIRWCFSWQMERSGDPGSPVTIPTPSPKPKDATFGTCRAPGASFFHLGKTGNESGRDSHEESPAEALGRDFPGGVCYSWARRRHLDTIP